MVWCVIDGFGGGWEVLMYLFMVENHISECRDER
jgi:hypothetical protein